MVSCTSVGCTSASLTGKPHCLDHHKAQSTYSYGLDHDIAQKFAAKWDDVKAQQVIDWLIKLTNGSAVTITSATDFQSHLKSGVLLCNALNVLWPTSITSTSISKSTMAFPQRENIVKFMDAAKLNGLRETDAFVTDDLYESRNLVVVLDSLIALGQLAKAKHVNAITLSVTNVTASAPIDINAEVKAQAQAMNGVTSPAVQPKQANNQSINQSINQSTSQSTNQSKFCGECGASRAQSTAKFCGECGKAYC